eukprot:gene4250-7587_t
MKQQLLLLSLVILISAFYFFQNKISTKIKTKIKSPLFIETPEFKQQQNFRRETIKKSFQHVWNGYTQHSFGQDELKPVTNQSINPFGGFGVTILDALDTMLLMNLTKEYESSLLFIKNLNFKKNVWVGIFETNIRIIGGLLGGYTLSKDNILLEKAKEMADLLLPAFNSRSGIPFTEINLKTGEVRNRNWHKHESLLSEIGTLQIEFQYLSYLLKDEKYKNYVDKITNILIKENKKSRIPGLYPCYIRTHEGTFTKIHISFGALGDSFYEYLLKQYLLSNKKEIKYFNMYKESIDAMKRYMVHKSSPSKLTYISEYLNFSTKYGKFDHLVCFLAGTLALGSLNEKRESDLFLAEELANTCYTLYQRSSTGIGPEVVFFDDDFQEDYHVKSSIYLLRPELVESLFILYRITGNITYCDMGWKIFEAIEKHCKTKSGYSEIKDVNQIPAEKSNGLQSFFLSETLKYLYLLFSPKEYVPLDKYIFNTEAHLFEVFDSSV